VGRSMPSAAVARDKVKTLRNVGRTFIAGFFRYSRVGT
jgi:hypothetical protein